MKISQISDPAKVCEDCNLNLSNIFVFIEKSQKVQQLLDELNSLKSRSPNKINELRQKFNLNSITASAEEPEKTKTFPLEIKEEGNSDFEGNN